ncbi:MAG: FlgD immunoglobulin-like domain containing protein [bacterium]
MLKSKSIFLLFVILTVNTNIYSWVMDYPYDAVVVAADKPEAVTVPSMLMILRTKLAHDLHKKIQSRYYIVTGRLGCGKTALTDGIPTNLKAPGHPDFEAWMGEWVTKRDQYNRYAQERIPGGVMLFIMLQSWGIDLPFLILVDDPAEVGSVCKERGFEKIGLIGNGSGPESEVMSSLTARDFSYTIFEDYANGDSVYQWIVDSAWVQPFNSGEQRIPMDVEAVFQQAYENRNGGGGPEDNSFQSDGRQTWHQWYQCVEQHDPPCYHTNISGGMVAFGRGSRAVNNFKQRKSKLLVFTGGGQYLMNSCSERCAIEAIAHGVPPENIYIDRWSGSSPTNCMAAYFAMKEKGCKTAMHTSLNGKDIRLWTVDGDSGGTLTATYGTAYWDGPEPFKMLGPVFNDEMMSITQLRYGNLQLIPNWGRSIGGWVETGEKLLLDYDDDMHFLNPQAKIYLENAVTGQSFKITEILKIGPVIGGGSYLYNRDSLKLYTPGTIPEGVYNIVFVNPDGHPGYHRAALGVGDRQKVNLDSLYRIRYRYDFRQPVKITWRKAAPLYGKNQIRICPNPGFGNLNIQLKVMEQTGSPLEFTVFNASGKALWHRMVLPQTRQYSMIWDGKNNQGKALSSGNYYLMVRNGSIENVRHFSIIK